MIVIADDLRLFPCIDEFGPCRAVDAVERDRDAVIGAGGICRLQAGRSELLLDSGAGAGAHDKIADLITGIPVLQSQFSAAQITEIFGVAPAVLAVPMECDLKRVGRDA